MQICNVDLIDLMDEGVLPEPLDLVLYVQFSSLEFRNLKVVGGGVG